MKKRGNQPFKPTKAQRNKVELLVSAGMSERAIASAMGFARDTLAKYFADELQNGHSRKLAENMARLEKAARSGNVTAMKYLDSKQIIVPEREPKPEAMGKKETLDVEAKTAHKDTTWGEVLN